MRIVVWLVVLAALVVFAALNTEKVPVERLSHECRPSRPGFVGLAMIGWWRPTLLLLIGTSCC